MTVISAAEVQAIQTMELSLPVVADLSRADALVYCRASSDQLIIVGEKTGTLSKATQNVRAHLKREIDRTLSIMVGAIEPILTISLAAAIGCILLAIYLPMFDMIGAMGGEQGKH